jgi:cobalt-zinc-cadmium efflux system membrane fusion protein
MVAHRWLPALLLVAACGSGGEDAAPPPRAPAESQAPKTVAARPASDAPLGIVPAVVTLPPEARVAVTTPFAGMVSRIHVIEGQQVRAGQLLATVVSRDGYALAAESARAAARLDLARANAARVDGLVRAGVVAAARGDEAAAQLRQAEVDQREAARLLAVGQAAPDGTVRLVAPIAGRVAKVAATTGAPLDGTNAPFVIDAAGPYGLELQLPERLAANVRPGMAVVLPDGSRGRILSVAPGLDPATRSVMARAALGHAPGLLSGRALSVTILGDATSGAVSVPAAAVVRVGGRDTVFVAAAGGGFAARPVTVGGRAGADAVLTEGLKPGERVAVSGIPELRAAAGA